MVGAMWLDGLAIFVLGLFAALGAWRGALSAGMRLVSLVAAYALSVFLAPAVAGAFTLPRVVAVPLGGTLVFVAAYFGLGLLSLVLSFMERRWRGDFPRTAFDRGFGGFFGVLRGGLLVLLVGWLALWVDALRVAGPLGMVPALGSSRVAEVTQKTVEAGVGLAVGKDTAGGRMTTKMMSHPGETAAALQGLVDNPRIEELRRDELFWTYVAAGSYDAALNRGSFLGIAHDESLRNQMGDLGLVSEHAAVDPRLFRNSVREVLAEIGPRIRNLQDDPEVRRLLADPEVQQALAAGDTLALLRHPGFQALVQRVTHEQN